MTFFFLEASLNHPHHSQGILRVLFLHQSTSRCEFCCVIERKTRKVNLKSLDDFLQPEPQQKHVIRTTLKLQHSTIHTHTHTGSRQLKRERERKEKRPKGVLTSSIFPFIKPSKVSVNFCAVSRWLSSFSFREFLQS